MMFLKNNCIMLYHFAPCMQIFIFCSLLWEKIKEKINYQLFIAHIYTHVCENWTPWRNSKKLMKFTPYIFDSSTNKRSNLQNKKTKRTLDISTLCVRQAERWEPVYVVALNQTGSVCNPGEWYSRWLQLEAKVYSYCDPHQLYEQVADQWNPRHAQWETYPGYILAVEEA